VKARTTTVSYVPRPARRGLRWGRALAYGVLAVASAGGVVYAHERLQQDALPIRSIAVDGASSDERMDEVALYAAVPKDAPLFGVDPDDVAGRVEEHPWVRSAVVRRVPPDALAIEIEERAAVAAAAFDTGVFLVDSAGVPFKRIGAGDAADLAVITGVDVDSLPRAVALLALAQHHEVDELRLEDGRATVQLADGTRAALGQGSWEKKLKTLARTMRELDERGLRAAHVYLDDDRRPERVAVRLRPRTEMGEDAGRKDRESGIQGAARAAPLGG
jgi:cell division protein FtsQ